MKKKPEVSITISTYNVDEFIVRSMDSIVGQSFKDVEIICIDDGSKDSTPEILKEYASKDSRITLILKTKNEGLAVSRNKALQLACGKYITFLDGDDLYDIDLVKKAYELAEEESSDMVIWDYNTFYQLSDLEKIDKNQSDLETLDKTNRISLLQRPAFTWVKLLRTDKIKQLGIHFPEGMTRQDIPIHWHLVTALDKVSLLPEKLSYYRQQPNATTAKKDSRVFDLAKVSDITKDYLVKNNLYAKYQDEFLRQRLNTLYGMYDSVKDELKKEAKQLVLERLSDDEWIYINSKKSLRRQARLFYKSINGNLIANIERRIWLGSRSVYRIIKSK
jgi:glycosyltransferase involved in cell wall biosynthesis